MRCGGKLGEKFLLMTISRYSDKTLIFYTMYTVDTTELKTSTSGQMFIDRYISAHLVIPSEDDNSYDCYCPYYFEDECYDFKTQCGCIKRTAFHDSNSELRICRQNNVIMDSMQISNMTDKINSTKLHIYEGYSRCPRCASGTCPYRNYVKALVLSHGKLTTHGTVMMMLT